MSEATHTVLWKRVTSALHGRSVGPAASQGALAAQARSKLGTDLVDQLGTANSVTNRRRHWFVRLKTFHNPWRQLQQRVLCRRPWSSNPGAQ